MGDNKKGVFLDVDSSIVEKNLRFTENEEEHLSQLLGAAREPPSKLIKPSPGFCVKTKEVGTDTKIFVNICETDAIPPPKDITELELQEILEEDCADFRVPMSIGEVRTDKDKQGADAKVIDIAINGLFLRKILDKKIFKEFFMAVVFEGINHKYGVTCVDEKIILKNKKAFGTLQMHRIEKREMDQKMGKTSVIDEITGQNQTNNPKVIEVLSDIKLREPEYKLFKRKGGQNCLYGEFKFPDVISAKEITVDIGEDRILLEAKQRGYLLDIFVPCVVRQESCSSVFEKSSKTLVVTMPLVGG